MAPNAYVLLDPSLTIVDMNDAYLAATKSRREDIIGRGLFEAFPDEPGRDSSAGVEAVKASLLKAIAQRRPDHLPLVAFGIEGPEGFEQRYWSATHIPMLDEKGEVRFVLQNTLDVTELTVLQAERARATASPPEERAAMEVIGRARAVQAVNRSLWAERAHLLRLFNEAPGFLAALREPGHIFELVNAAYMRLVGREDLAGRTIRDTLPEVADQGFLEILDETVRTGRAYVGRSVRILLQPRVDGPPEERYVDFVFQPMTDAEGVVTGILVQGHDITDQKRAEACAA